MKNLPPKVETFPSHVKALNTLHTYDEIVEINRNKQIIKNHLNNWKDNMLNNKEKPFDMEEIDSQNSNLLKNRHFIKSLNLDCGF